MKKYKVEKYFLWGPLNLEKQQQLEITPDPETENTLWVNLVGSQKKMRVNAKALQNMIEDGKLSDA